MRNTTYTYINKQYELSNHLGNVLVTTSDLRKGTDINEDGIADYYNAIVTTANDYYAFGSYMNGRQYNSIAYNYSFNTQLKSDEISGNGNHTTALFWEYDSRLGRRWNVDPVPQFSISDYVCFADNPIMNIDHLGDKVKGVDNNSVIQTRDAIKNFFTGKTNFQNLIKLDADGVTLSTIDNKAFKKALREDGFTEDQKKLAIAYKNVINKTTETHMVEFVDANYTGTLSSFAQNISKEIKISGIESKFGGAVTNYLSDGNGKHIGSGIVMITGYDITPTDYVDPYGNITKGTASIQENLAHELLSHAAGWTNYSSTYKSNDAIQMGNLCLRSICQNYYYRNGNNHEPKISLSKEDTNKIPIYLEKEYFLHLSDILRDEVKKLFYH